MRAFIATALVATYSASIAICGLVYLLSESSLVTRTVRDRFTTGH